MSKLRTLQICLDDIPEERILIINNKRYVLLKTYDYDTTNERDEDFSVSLILTPEQQLQKKNGEKIKNIFVGTGQIWK